MAAIINSNLNSLTAQRNLSQSQASLSTSMQRLSSGLRINSAKDDAAGLSIAERFTSQIRGMSQAARNANDGISMSQTAEGALGAAGGILQRVRELAVQSANATNSASDRAALNAEVGQLTSELDRIAKSTQFNGQNILDGSFTSAQFQVGANAGQTITATTANFSTSAYGNYRVGALAATATSTAGELTFGSTAGAEIGKANTALGASIIAGGAITINGSYGTATATAIAGDSAKTVAAAINAVSGQTGVKASATTEVNLTGFAAATSYTLKIASNNSSAQPQTIAFTVGAAVNADGLSGAVNAINDAASKTGVTAKVDSTGTNIVLTNSSGEDIRVINDSATGNDLAVTDRTGANSVTATAANGAGAFGTDDAWITGEITLDSEKSFNVVDAAAGAGGFFLTATTGDASQLQKVSDLDVSNVDAANRTLAIVDSAIAAVSGQRAKFGALQSRFDSTISNLQTSIENSSAARSRTQDADFAVETANLSRAQILQQAGTAMVAQANQLPQGVLALLR